MTKAETVRILAVLKAAYPHAFKNLTKADAEAMLNLWAMQFEADSADLVAAAVNALISSRQAGYSPTIGEVKAQMQKLTAKEELSEAAAWALVSKACANGIYGYREEFAKLPEAVQRAVGAPEQLKAWAMMDEDTVESVVASNFKRSYRADQERQKENEMLPKEVKDMLSGVADQMRIEKPPEKKPQLLPPKLEPMRKPENLPEIKKPEQQETSYKAPDFETWERKRQKAMRMLGL